MLVSLKLCERELLLFFFIIFIFLKNIYSFIHCNVLFLRRFELGYIQCCGALRKTRTYEIEDTSHKFKTCILDVLQCCPVCQNYVIQLTRVDYMNNICSIRKRNTKAVKFFIKLKPFIIHEFDNYKVQSGSKFFLYYNEFGTKKRCYSSLRSLKIGKLDNFEKIIVNSKIDKIPNFSYDK